MSDDVTKPAKLSGDGTGGGKGADRDAGIGCAVALVAFNALLMGLLAGSFAVGSYSSREQELWYRYGSLGFLFLGAIMPAVALFFGGRRSPAFMLILVVWMIAVLFGWFGYAMLSGGGV